MNLLKSKFKEIYTNVEVKKMAKIIHNYMKMNSKILKNDKNVKNFEKIP